MPQVVKLDDPSITEMETPKRYSDSSSTGPPLLRRPDGAKVSSSPSRIFDSFRPHPAHKASRVLVGKHGRVFNADAAAHNTANTALVRKLKGRHLQMIAIGGSIGAGLFIGSGQALATGGPASLLIAFILIGGVLFCTVQALGEMAVTFPIAGSFSAFATRFIDPAWGFASGWNYGMQWLFVMPLEVMAAAICLEFWSLPIPRWASITFFLLLIISINLFGVRFFGEAEYCFSIMKVAAVVGFIILGVIINCAGTPDSGYIGGRYWADPGAFHGGMSGFTSILVTAAFSFSGTELVGLAAAETHNPSQSLPTASKQVFWRILIFYVLAITIVGLLVPYTDPRVANSSMYGATRTLQALAEQGQAPRILAYVDREGRPIASILLASIIGLVAYLYISPIQGAAFTWLLALSGLSSIFTWLSICYAHIMFRKAWALQGNSPSDLIYRSPVGTTGSWVGLISLVLVLIAQVFVAISPAGSTGNEKAGERISNFFEACLAAPVVFLFYIFYKVWYKTRWIRVGEIDLQTGRNTFESEFVRQQWRDDESTWPQWKKVYKTLC
ncbi:Amino acid transporter-like protein [Venustampulla echinocandica]|uniref:Amino acid transporter-like protein n=1 Tax=Venustampulla echinocandica TaxID=2656787 RepID=A0A370TD74_9HELO|nr:Amino acid transporter-like protein [Venustampulla echinocandica]RDL32381.1 Amino acid transporter-like protein [Venustampulla echinocandica]